MFLYFRDGEMKINKLLFAPIETHKGGMRWKYENNEGYNNIIIIITII